MFFFILKGWCCFVLHNLLILLQASETLLPLFSPFVKFHKLCFIRSETGIHLCSAEGTQRTVPTCVQNTAGTLSLPQPALLAGPSPWASAAAGSAQALASSKVPSPAAQRVWAAPGGDMTTCKHSGPIPPAEGSVQNSQRVVVFVWDLSFLE